MDENDISFFKDGLRLDGRRADELRPVKIEWGSWPELMARVTSRWEEIR
jgi:RNase PH